MCRVSRLVMTLLILLGAVQACKPRNASRASIKSGDSAAVDPSNLDSALNELAAIESELENRDVLESNQWYAPHIYAQLDARTKTALGDPALARGGATSVALADGPPKAIDTEGDALYRRRLELKAKITEMLALEAKRRENNEASVKQSMCRVTADGNYTGCMCYHRWRFDQTYPKDLLGPNRCDGAFGNFCATGFAFQVPSFSKHPELMNFPAHPNYKGQSFPRSDVMFFLERDFTYRGCRELNEVSWKGHAKSTKDSLKADERAGTWSRSEGANPQPVVDKPDGGFRCFDFRRKGSEMGKEPGVANEPTLWLTGQCLPLAGYQSKEKVSDGVVYEGEGDNRVPVDVKFVDKLRDDPNELVPLSDINRFSMKQSKRPFARVYCAREWVNSSTSLDEAIKYGSITEISATYAAVDVSLSIPDGSYRDLDSGLAAARESVDRRWQTECVAAARYNQSHPLAPVKENIYNWRCEGEAHWSGAYQGVDGSPPPPAREADKPKGTYCSFLDERYEAVRQCELARGNVGSETCCVDTLTKMGIPNADVQCTGFARKVTFRGLNQLDAAINCAKAELNWYANPALGAVASLVELCRKNPENLVLTLPDGNKFPFLATEKPDKLNNEELTLARRRRMLNIVSLEKEAALLSKERNRGMALNPARDCARVGRLQTDNSFLGCHELFPKAAERVKDNRGCFEDESLPDGCLGDPSAECVTIPAVAAGQTPTSQWMCTPPMPGAPQRRPTGCSCNPGLKFKVFR